MARKMRQRTQRSSRFRSLGKKLTVFVTDDFPELGTNLVTALTCEQERQKAEEREGTEEK